MYKKISLLFSFLVLSLNACGGGDGGNLSPNPSTNPIPNVAGTYDCIGGCRGADCNFALVLEVTQTGSNFIAHDPDPQDPASDLTGTLNSDGQISATMDNGTCTGQFIQGRVVAQCTVENTRCQDVTYTRRN